MLGLMQQSEMNLIRILEYAARIHADAKIISKISAEQCHQYSYRQAYSRVGQLAHALDQLGVGSNSTVATLAWNDFRHFESWYGIAGLGAICHTVNPRLFPRQLSYIINTGGAKTLMVAPCFAALVAELLPALEHIEHIIWLSDEADMPVLATNAKQYCYETLLSGQPEQYNWPELPEHCASSLCFTSGTTGAPKGVLYSHRSNMLMAVATRAPDGFNLSTDSTVLMVVPMFHANSWGLVYSAPMSGAQLVLPGAFLDGQSLHQLIRQYAVTFSAAVPTVWTMLLHYLTKHSLDCCQLKEVVIGGAAVPASMIAAFRQQFGVNVVHAWGMTELSPLGTINRAPPAVLALSDEQQLAYATKQGRPLFGMELQLRDDQDLVLAQDGKTSGRLLVRGPWVLERYLGQDNKAVDAEGWFDTGDIATIDALGCMQITDRAKDIIKSGGEWISSVELENICSGHPDVLMAAVIAKPDEKWTERPLLLVKLKETVAASDQVRQSILDYLSVRVSKWWLPDELRFVTEIPLTATGKTDKKLLRDYHLS